MIRTAGNIEFWATASGFTAGVPPMATFTTTVDCGTAGARTFSVTGQQLVDGISPTVKFRDVPGGTVCRILQATRQTPLNAYAWNGLPTISTNPTTVTAACTQTGSDVCREFTVVAAADHYVNVLNPMRQVLVTLTSNLNPAIVGMPVTLSATLNVAGTTGSINFRIAGGGVSLLSCGAVAISSGVATRVTSSSSATALAIEAAYIPGNQPAETSTVIEQVWKTCGGSDGVVILRRILGMSGAALIASGIEAAPTAKRTSDVAIAAWIDAQCGALLPINRPLDLDDNGVVEARTDGLMLLRALLGFTGTAVTQGALGTGTLGRGDWTLIRNHLDSTCNLGLVN